MAWIPLQHRLHALPLVLTGPILRRTEGNGVTVWLVLKSSRTVTLEIFDTHKNLLITGSHKTIQLGKNLHVVAVTAKTTRNVLLPGESYFYNLDFGNGETLSSPGVLTAVGSMAEITYYPDNFPSFPLPPSHLNDVRIVHGSCRKPHGESADALIAVDKMIGEALAQDAKKRPQQLFLTGDQIYADEVADALLFMLRDASETLLGWNEILPDVKNLADLHPGKRNDLATFTAGLTTSLNKFNLISQAAKSHLFTFGEFLTMYLFAWSDVLWCADLPSFADVNPMGKQWGCERGVFAEEVKYLKEFRTSLPGVRRALANVPTYMIFDDHEVTDDWYLNMAWCDRVLSQPLGRRILQNGLLAYAICQAWGNTPDQFTPDKPGGALLTAAVAWADSGGTNQDYEQKICDRIGLPTLNDIRNSHPKRLPNYDKAIQWHYSIKTPCYEVIVLDTRTQREFPGKDFDFPGLLSAEACDIQIPPVTPSPPPQVTLIISPGPVVGLPFIEGIQKQAKTLGEKLATSAWGFDPEAWSLQESAFERLLARLALRASPQNRSRVVILSGDVHYSFAARLQYAATRPFENAEAINTQLIIAQFTCSSLRNEEKKFGGSHSLHRQGFVSLAFKPNLPKAEILAWSNPDNQELEVGDLYTFIEDTVQYIPWRSQDNPTKIDVVKERNWSRVLQITRKPQWWYRVDFLSANVEEVNNLQRCDFDKPKTVVTPLPGQPRQPALRGYLAQARNQRDRMAKWGRGKEIVGVNNLGEITFELVNNTPITVQTLWWRLESFHDGKLLEPFPLTRTEVSLLFDDENYPMAELLKEVKPSANSF